MLGDVQVRDAEGNEATRPTHATAQERAEAPAQRRRTRLCRRRYVFLTVIASESDRTIAENGGHDKLRGNGWRRLVCGTHVLTPSWPRISAHPVGEAVA